MTSTPADLNLPATIFDSNDLALKTKFSNLKLVNALKKLREYKQYKLKIKALPLRLTKMLWRFNKLPIIKDIQDRLGILDTAFVVLSGTISNLYKKSKVMRKIVKRRRNATKKKRYLLSFHPELEFAKEEGLLKTLKGKKLSLWHWLSLKQKKQDKEHKKYYKKSYSAVRNFINLIHRVNGISTFRRKRVAVPIISTEQLTKKGKKKKVLPKKAKITYKYVRRKIPAILPLRPLNDKMNLFKKLLLARGAKRIHSVIEKNHISFSELQVSNAKSREVESKKREVYKFAYFKRRRKTRLLEIKEALKLLCFAKKRKLRKGFKFARLLRKFKYNAKTNQKLHKNLKRARYFKIVELLKHHKKREHKYLNQARPLELFKLLKHTPLHYILRFKSNVITQKFKKAIVLQIYEYSFKKLRYLLRAALAVTRPLGVSLPRNNLYTDLRDQVWDHIQELKSISKDTRLYPQIRDYLRIRPLLQRLAEAQKTYRILLLILKIYLNKRKPKIAQQFSLKAQGKLTKPIKKGIFVENILLESLFKYAIPRRLYNPNNEKVIRKIKLEEKLLAIERKVRFLHDTIEADVITIAYKKKRLKNKLKLELLKLKLTTEILGIKLKLANKLLGIKLKLKKKPLDMRLKKKLLDMRLKKKLLDMRLKDDVMDMKSKEDRLRIRIRDELLDMRLKNKAFNRRLTNEAFDGRLSKNSFGLTLTKNELLELKNRLKKKRLGVIKRKKINKARVKSSIKILRNKIGTLKLERANAAKSKSQMGIRREIVRGVQEGFVLTRKNAKKRASIRRINTLWQKLNPIIKIIKKWRLKKEVALNKVTKPTKTPEPQVVKLKPKEDIPLWKKELAGKSKQEKRRNYYQKVMQPRIQAEKARKASNNKLTNIIPGNKNKGNFYSTQA